MKVRKHTLLLLACLVWAIAGINILRIGLMVYPEYITLINLLISVLIFCIFQYFVFGKLVQKHTVRITGYSEEYQFFFKFFDIRAFIIMAFMMSSGIFLRVSHLVPDWFIAIFYTGLGASLLLAGILFGNNYRKALVRH